MRTNVYDGTRGTIVYDDLLVLDASDARSDQRHGCRYRSTGACLNAAPSALRLRPIYTGAGAAFSASGVFRGVPNLHTYHSPILDHSPMQIFFQGLHSPIRLINIVYWIPIRLHKMQRRGDMLHGLTFVHATATKPHTWHVWPPCMHCICAPPGKWASCHDGPPLITLRNFFIFIFI